MTEPPAVHAAHTYELTAAVRDEIRTLLDTAFDGDFGDDDWEHSLGGVHALVRDTGGSSSPTARSSSAGCSTTAVRCAPVTSKPSPSAPAAADRGSATG